MSLVVSGLLLGVLGATHCVAMCGGFAGLGGARPSGGGPDVAASKLVMSRTVATSHPLALLLAQNAGRVASYATFGVIAGAIGATLGQGLSRGQALLEVVSGLLLVGVGAFLVGLLPSYATLERLGAPAFRKLEPHARRLLPLRTPAQAAAFGVIWGFLPCGLVYSALGIAATSGSAATGGLVMLAFGLGTLPALLAMGVLADTVASFAKRRVVRSAAGVMLVAFGVTHLAMAMMRLRGG